MPNVDNMDASILLDQTTKRRRADTIESDISQPTVKRMQAPKEVNIPVGSDDEPFHNRNNGVPTEKEGMHVDEDPVPELMVNAIPRQPYFLRQSTRTTNQYASRNVGIVKQTREEIAANKAVRLANKAEARSKKAKIDEQRVIRHSTVLSQMFKTYQMENSQYSQRTQLGTAAPIVGEVAFDPPRRPMSRSDEVDPEDGGDAPTLDNLINGDTGGMDGDEIASNITSDDDDDVEGVGGNGDLSKGSRDWSDGLDEWYAETFGDAEEQEALPKTSDRKAGLEDGEETLEREEESDIKINTRKKQKGTHKEREPCSEDDSQAEGDMTATLSQKIAPLKFGKPKSAKAQAKAMKVKADRARILGEEGEHDGQGGDNPRLTRTQEKAKKNTKAAKEQAVGESRDTQMKTGSRASKSTNHTSKSDRKSGLKPDWRKNQVAPPKKPNKPHANEDDVQIDNSDNEEGEGEETGGWRDEDVEQRPLVSSRKAGSDRQIVSVVPFRDLKALTSRPSSMPNAQATPGPSQQIARPKSTQLSQAPLRSFSSSGDASVAPDSNGDARARSHPSGLKTPISTQKKKSGPSGSSQRRSSGSANPDNGQHPHSDNASNLDLDSSPLPLRVSRTSSGDARHLKTMLQAKPNSTKARTSKHGGQHPSNVELEPGPSRSTSRKDKHSGDPRKENKTKSATTNDGKGKGKREYKDRSSTNALSRHRMYDNAMDVDPNNVSVEWQKHAAQRPDMKATVFHFVGMRADPFNIDTTEFQELLQLMVDVLFAHKGFIVEVGCPLYRKLRQGISDWRAYFLIASTRSISSALQAENLAQTSKGFVVSVSKHRRPGVATFAVNALKTGAAFYERPNIDKKLRRGHYLSQYIIETFTAAHAKKIMHSFLHKCFKADTFLFPFGALKLTAYAVHLGFCQFRTGNYIKSSFAQDTAPKLLNGHTINLQKLTDKALNKFTEAIKVFNPKEVVRSQSSAFDTVDIISSDDSASESEVASGSGSGSGSESE